MSYGNYGGGGDSGGGWPDPYRPPSRIWEFLSNLVDTVMGIIIGIPVAIIVAIGVTIIGIAAVVVSLASMVAVILFVYLMLRSLFDL